MINEAASNPHTDLAIAAATETILNGYRAFRRQFNVVTKRARLWFEQRNWHAMRRDSVTRLDLYLKQVAKTAADLKTTRPVPLHPAAAWRPVKNRYAKAVAGWPDSELARTFFNSVHRRVFQNADIDPECQFITPRSADGRPGNVDGLFHVIPGRRPLAGAISDIYGCYHFENPYIDLDTDVRLVSGRLEWSIGQMASGRQWRMEMLKAPFYRDMNAYLIGRIVTDHAITPIAIVLASQANGIITDAVLVGVEDIRVLFSYTRSYFHVQCQQPEALVAFLGTLMPGKSLAELYIGLGYHKHGKTELYRDLLNHQQVCGTDRFDFSPGQRGMVMIAFNMPRDELIYKLIRDRFDRPKTATRRQVVDKYDFVFKHDRAGRLVDVQTFENLKMDRCCFTDALLEEIRQEAAGAADIGPTHVTLRHVYVERRVTPLDVYLQNAEAANAKGAVLDYGNAIKDLARMNVFPGDMLVKNFGVTRLGRVVFYDYDELCPLTHCRFRRLPAARRFEEEIAAEPWFMVDEYDVFPEEFAFFLGLPDGLRQLFIQYHGDLLNVSFWQDIQDRIRVGRLTTIRPYKKARRLRLGGAMRTGRVS